MESGQTARRKNRAKQRAEYYAAWTIVYIIEVVLAAAPAAMTAAVLIPRMEAVRGYQAVGGEYLFIAMVFYIAYRIIHKKVCDIVYGKED